MEVDEYSVNKMKDFLYIYNKMAETCFNHCIENFTGRQLTPNEESCIEKCSSKGVAVNHKLMMSYMELQPEIVNKRTEEMQKLQDSTNVNGSIDAVNDSTNAVNSI